MEELARRKSEPPPSDFRESAVVVKRALQERVGLEVSDEQLENALAASEGRDPSGEWVVERVEGDEVHFRRHDPD